MTVSARHDAAESLAGNVLLRVPEVADTLVRTINQQNPAYRDRDSVPAQDLWQSCHDNITRVVQMIAGVDATTTDDLFDAAHRTGQRRAEQRMPLDDVLRSFRLGGRLVWEALTDEARIQGVADMSALLPVASKVWEVVDNISSQVAIAYHRAERELSRIDEQRRGILWDGLLRGDARNPEFAHEVAAALGVRIDDRFLVLTTGSVAETQRTVTTLERRLAAGRIRAVWQLGTHVVGLLTPGTATRDAVLDLVRDAVTTAAGLSDVVIGLAEVDVAFRQATLARRTLPAGRTGVVALDERLPQALLVSSPDLARRLVDAWLTALLALPAGERDLLLDTLDTWVAAAGSVRRTAELAHCHRNTVINRLRRIHQITGRDVTDPACQVELAMALCAVRLCPPRHD